MKSRRDVIQALSGLAVLPMLPRLAEAATRPADDDLSQVTATAEKFFSDLGYTKNPPKSLLTGDTFNGGVCFDETLEFDPPGKWFAIQPCSRVEDYNRGSEDCVLAYFHILSLYNSENKTFDNLLRQCFSFLFGPCKLDPARLVIVSTNRFQPYLETAKSYGIKDTHFVQRNFAEAKAQGDGSGYFNPKGLPYIDGGCLTASFNYLMKPDAPLTESTYPVKDSLELGELGVTDDPQANINPQSAGLGLERIMTAMGTTAPSFEQTRKLGLAAMSDEAKQSDKPLPSAYQQLTRKTT